MPTPIQTGMATALGGRPEQQDVGWIHTTPDMTFGAVLDGHGSEGGAVARCVQAQLQAYLHPASRTTPEITAWFHGVHQALLDTAVDCYLSGTTLALARVQPGMLTVWNTGDSGVAVVSRVGRGEGANGEKEGEGEEGRWESVKVTRDHTCNDPDELTRVLAAGARVERAIRSDGGQSSNEDPLRIYKGTLPYPGLVVTRSLGDTVARKLGVIPHPDVVEHPLPLHGWHAVVVASDGVWDALTVHDLQALVVRAVGPRAATQHPAAAASRKGGVGTAPRRGAFAQYLADTILEAALQALDAKQLDDNVTVVCCVVGTGPSGWREPEEGEGEA